MERCLEWPLLLVSKDLASLLRWNWCFLETNISQVMSHIRSHWFCSNIWARDMRLLGTVPSTPWQFLLIGESVIANSPGLARWNPSLSPYETPTDLGLMMSLDLLRCDVARDWLLTSAHDQRRFRFDQSGQTWIIRFECRGHDYSFTNNKKLSKMNEC